jgi:quinolinate synthase
MQKASPNKTFIPAPPNNACACNDCPHMKLNTLEKLYNCLYYEQPEIVLSEDIIARARRPIERMLELSAQLGL